MGSRIRPIQPEDFGSIHRDLLQTLDPKISKDRWRSLFDWTWANPEDHVGFGLFDPDDRPLGYIATIYSRQDLGGKPHTVCNFSSWIVADGHKSSALSLVMPVLSRRNLTITNLTAIPSVGSMFRKLGFKTLETHAWVAGPQALLKGSGQSGLRVRVPGEPSEMPDSVDVRRRFVDHRVSCHHWILEAEGESCYLAFTIGRRRRLRTLRIHYLSNPSLFAAGIPTLQRKAVVSFAAPFLECDQRLLKGVKPRSGRPIPLAEPRLFRSRDVDSAEISNLYSELPLLRL